MLNYLQQYTYNVLMSGYSVFLSGGAGTGKTYVIDKFINDSRNKGRNVMVCAPTGVAALHINGSTLHHQFKAPVKPIIKRAIDESALSELIDTDILVIDEISMCRIDLFDFIANYIFNANETRKRFNKPRIQLVISGDFLQLPPVMTESDKKILDTYYNRDINIGFAFESEFWGVFDFKYIILTEIVRQDNKEFVEVLNRIRTGDKLAVQYIIDHCSKVPIDGAINLYGLNKTATERNVEELNEIDDNMYTHEAIITGAAKITDTNAEMMLAIKVGSRVMSLVNKKSSDGSLIYGNGSLGTVVSIQSDYVTVEFDAGFIENIGLYTWDIYKYSIDEKTKDSKFPKLVETKIGDVTQFPLKLAYAATIHKAQGQTYDAVNISPYAWDCGQLYVALSRVKSIDRLYLNYDISTDYVVTSLNVIEFYNKIVKEANKDLDTTVDLLEQKPVKYEDNDINKLLNLLGK